MRYLAKWRMQLAAHLLAQPGCPVEAMAAKVSYRSEASFNRAFKSIVGRPPGVWRRAQMAVNS
jgi:AraC-like DNA-binding protein